MCYVPLTLRKIRVRENKYSSTLYVVLQWSQMGFSTFEINDLPGGIQKNDA